MERMRAEIWRYGKREIERQREGEFCWIIGKIIREIKYKREKKRENGQRFKDTQRRANREIERQTDGWTN
jgi:hypothetical protein